ncbi:hypothetical protein [Vibrio sp. WXL210]|uniref:hypothetical protein n=1 Tax=Vibrio sp. WXL210 TaxID=3450709 RepID=UPI003EC865C9
MSHYDEQHEKFENQPRPYFSKRDTGSAETRQSLNKRDEEIEQLYESSHPIIFD